MVLVWFVIAGVGSIEQLLIDVVIVLVIFGATYVIAEFFLRALGGEMDPPASRGYRRRP